MDFMQALLQRSHELIYLWNLVPSIVKDMVIQEAFNRVSPYLSKTVIYWYYRNHG